MTDPGQAEKSGGPRSGVGLGMKLLMGFLALALIPLALVSALSYTNARESLQEAAMSRLQATSDLKTAFITNWFSYRFLDLDAQATSLENARLLADLSETFESSGKELEEFVDSYQWTTIVEGEGGADLKSFRRTYGYHDVLLINLEGNILFTAIAESDLGSNLFDGPRSQSLFAEACKETLRTGRSSFSDFEIYAPSGDAVAGFLTSVIVDESGDKLGLIAFEISTGKIDGIMQDRAGLGDTGQTYLVGNDLILRSNFAQDEHVTILRQRVDTVGVQEWHKNHIANTEGVHEDEHEAVLKYTGPHGKQVFGIHSNIDIAGVSWAMVSEIEVAEALASVTRLRNLAILLMMGTGLTVIAVAVSAAGRIVQPIRELSRVTKLVAAGDLDQEIRTDIPNEIGELAHSFNRMLAVRRSAEEALKESEEKNRAIVDTAVDGIVTIDAQGIIQTFNPAAEHVFGYSEEEVKGCNVSMLMPDPFRSAHDGYLDNFLSSGIAKIIGIGRDVVGLRKDGTTFPMSLAVSQVHLDDQVLFTGIVRDISERKDSEDRLAEFAKSLHSSNLNLERVNLELERSNKELDDFAQVASHDLQEPLRKIQAFGDRLASKYQDELGENGQDYLARMQSAAGRMQVLIHDLLTYSRVTTKAKPFERVDLSAVAHEVLSDLEVRVRETGGGVEIGQLPVIDADPMQMRQLFQNLIGNALKYHRPGVAPKVTVRDETVASLANGFCRICVEDNGIGFDEEYNERIFEVFQRLHGRDEYEGTGVGLAVCRKIVDRHEGRISARSVSGKGAAFTVALPLHHQEKGAENE